MSEATIIIGHWSSTCSACGRGATPAETSHDTALGYSIANLPPDDPGRRGCGARFVAVAAEYGESEREMVQAMRPDLPYRGAVSA